MPPELAEGPGAATVASYWPVQPLWPFFRRMRLTTSFWIVSAPDANSGTVAIERGAHRLGVAGRPKPGRRLHEALQAGQDGRALLCV